MSADEQNELVALPLGRVRRLMKDAAHVRAVSQEASLLVAKAAELFTEALAARALECKTGEGKLAFSDLGARTLAASAKHTWHPQLSAHAVVAAAVATTDRLDFLADTVPRKRAAREVVASLGAEAHLPG